jgi:hypothetical protein
LITDLMLLVSKDGVSVQAVKPYITVHTQDESTCEVIVDFLDDLAYQRFSISSLPHATAERCLEEIMQRYITHDHRGQVKAARLQMLGKLIYWRDSTVPRKITLVKELE